MVEEEVEKEVWIRRTAAAKRWRMCRPSRGTGSAVTVEKPVRTGPPSTWASHCVSCVLEYTGTNTRINTTQVET